jgi:hypothetical protein
MKPVTEVQKDDIVLFKNYKLRVEREPKRIGNFVILQGRINVDGCPFVTKKFLYSFHVTIQSPD